MIRELLAVGIGGAAGSIARYVLSYTMLAEQTLCGFPAGTFTVNAVGSLLIGLLAGAAADSAFVMRLLAIGFCGGFTTFSTFSADTVRLLRDGQYAPAALYMGLSIIVCIACVAVGIWFGQLLKNI